MKDWATKLPVQYILGGLAPDTQDPMPQEMQTWLKIQQTIPGAGFNLDFWTTCQPRRSTYPACRAVIATRHQQPALEAAMILAVQEAYYLNASNPSDMEWTFQDLNTALSLPQQDGCQSIRWT